MSQWFEATQGVSRHRNRTWRRWSNLVSVRQRFLSELRNGSRITYTTGRVHSLGSSISIAAWSLARRATTTGTGLVSANGASSRAPRRCANTEYGRVTLSKIKHTELVCMGTDGSGHEGGEENVGKTHDFDLARQYLEQKLDR